MAALAILTVWLLTLPHSSGTELANRVIWGIFVLDYVVRLGRAPDRKRFVREHLIELIAILPWDWFRAARVLRLVRLLRAGVWIWRATRELRAIARQNGLASVLAVASGIVALGGAIFWLVEPAVHSYGEALWWAIVTVTTVGSEDIAPHTTTGRSVAAVLMLVGIGVIGMLTSSLATSFLGARQHAGNPTIEHIRERLAHWDELDPTQRRQLATMLWILANESAGAQAPHGHSAEIVGERPDLFCDRAERPAERSHFLSDQAGQ